LRIAFGHLRTQWMHFAVRSSVYKRALHAYGMVPTHINWRSTKIMSRYFFKIRSQQSQEKDNAPKIATHREALFVGLGFEVARTGSVLPNRVVIWRGRTRRIIHSIIHSNSKAIKIYMNQQTTLTLLQSADDSTNIPA
jgi:hypothetical protein